MVCYNVLGLWLLSDHWWSLPSDPLVFPDLFLDRQPTARCPSWPHWKQWLQLAIPWVIQGLHFPFTEDLDGGAELSELTCVDSEGLPSEVRAFSIVLAKADTCAVSSCRAARCAWTSAWVCRTVAWTLAGG